MEYINETPHSVPANLPGNPRLINRSEVMERTSLTRSGLSRAVKYGMFPAPIQISANRVAWYEHEVEAWILAPKYWTVGGLWVLKWFSPSRQHFKTHQADAGRHRWYWRLSDISAMENMPRP